MAHADWLITGLEKPSRSSSCLLVKTSVVQIKRKTSGNTFPYRPPTQLISPQYMSLTKISHIS